VLHNISLVEHLYISPTTYLSTQGWVNEDAILKHAASVPSNTTRVLVCGLPGVYDKLCGPRDDEQVAAHSVLWRLGYTTDMVIKL
jgi:hypothetical protein